MVDRRDIGGERRRGQAGVDVRQIEAAAAGQFVRPVQRQREVGEAGSQWIEPTEGDYADRDRWG